MAPGSTSTAKRRKRVNKNAAPLPTGVPELEVGTDVMRRGSVKEVQKSGMEHLRGVILEIEGTRVTIRWCDTKEESVSLRRAQTMADAFRRLPATHEFRRRKTMIPTPRKVKKTAISPKNDEAPTPPKAKVKALAKKIEAVPPDTTAIADENMLPPKARPAPDESVISSYSKEALENLRSRKASPEMKIEWHGGKGFGNREETWVSVSDGHFRRRASLASRDDNGF